MAANRIDKVNGRINLLINSINTTPKIKKLLVKGGRSPIHHFLLKIEDQSTKNIIDIDIIIVKEILLVGVNT